MEKEVTVNIPKLLRFLDRGNTFKYSYQDQSISKGLVVIELKKDKTNPNIVLYDKVKGTVSGSTLTIASARRNKFDDRREKDYRRFERKIFKEVNENQEKDIEFSFLGDIIGFKN